MVNIKREVKIIKEITSNYFTFRIGGVSQRVYTAIKFNGESKYWVFWLDNGEVLKTDYTVEVVQRNIDDETWKVEEILDRNEKDV